MYQADPVGGDHRVDVSSVEVVARLLRTRACRQVERRVSDLGLPVEVWCRLLHDAARQAGMHIVTTLAPEGHEGRDAAGPEQLLIVQLANTGGP